MIRSFVNLYVENLNDNDAKRFEDLVQIYEDKDVKRHQKKLIKTKILVVR